MRIALDGMMGYCLLLTVLPVLAAAVQAGDFQCTTNKDGTLCLARYTGAGGTVDVPAAVDGKPVTVIGKGAFRCPALTSVTLPDGVTAVEDGSLSDVGGDASWPSWPLGARPVGAFAGCTNLTRVSMGNHMARIGDYAFAVCTGLKTVTLPPGVRHVGRGAFANCIGLTGADLNQGLATIEQQAFENCVGLTSVTLPDSLQTVGAWAFQGCGGLTELTVPDRVTALGHGAFRRCAGLTRVSVGVGVKTMGRYVFSMCPNLRGVYLAGERPPDADGDLFFHSPAAVVHRRPAANGWPRTWSGRRVAVWE